MCKFWKKIGYFLLRHLVTLATMLLKLTSRNFVDCLVYFNDKLCPLVNSIHSDYGCSVKRDVQALIVKQRDIYYPLWLCQSSRMGSNLVSASSISSTLMLS